MVAYINNFNNLCRFQEDVELEPQTEAADWPVAHKSILIS